MASDAPALATGFYWYAEKLMWGYDDVENSPDVAFKPYQEAARLGFSDAYLRTGHLLEYGKGTAQNGGASAARHYIAAAKLGNYCAYAFLGSLLLRARQIRRGEAAWDRFFQLLQAAPSETHLAATPAERSTTISVGSFDARVPLVRLFKPGDALSGVCESFQLFYRTIRSPAFAVVRQRSPTFAIYVFPGVRARAAQGASCAER